MQGRNPLGYADHQPFTGFSDELVYGIKRDGGTAHISEVVRGLRCDCRCPACDQVLVAKKGLKQLHHFAHYNKGISCSHVAETNAHIWAKQVLEREKRLTIPPIVAEHGGHTEIVSPAKVYVFAVNRRPIGTPYRRAKGTPFALRGSVDTGRRFRAAGGVGRA